MSAIKVGVSRQVAIPKKLHDELGLSPGDYLEVELKDGRLILTPKQLIEKRLAEGLADIKAGRVSGPFTSGKAVTRSLRRPQRKVRSTKRS